VSNTGSRPYRLDISCPLFLRGHPPTATSEAGTRLPLGRGTYSIVRKQPMVAGPAGQDDTGPRAVAGRM